MPDPALLVPLVENCYKKFSFDAVVSTVAEHGRNLEALEKTIAELLPEGPFLYPEDHVTDQSPSFLAAEMIREKLFRYLGREVPYCTAVQIENLKTKQACSRFTRLFG